MVQLAAYLRAGICAMEQTELLICGIDSLSALDRFIPWLQLVDRPMQLWFHILTPRLRLQALQTLVTFTQSVLVIVLLQVILILVLVQMIDMEHKVRLLEVIQLEFQFQHQLPIQAQEQAAQTPTCRLTMPWPTL